MIEYLTNEEAAALIMQNDPHFHSKRRGCELQKKDDTKKCKTHKVDICNPNANDCGWELSDQGDWHYGRFFPRLKQYRVFTEEQVHEIRSGKLMLFELSYKYRVNRRMIRDIQKGIIYTNIGNPPYIPPEQNEAITP